MIIAIAILRVAPSVVLQDNVNTNVIGRKAFPPIIRCPSAMTTTQAVRRGRTAAVLPGKGGPLTYD